MKVSKTNKPKNTLNTKAPKDLPAKKPVKGGFVIYGSGNVAGDPLPTEYSRIYSDGALR